MHHCVATLIPEIATGGRVVVRVTEPERATAELVQLEWSGLWDLGQIAGPCNAVVRPETRAAVKAWLAELNEAYAGLDSHPGGADIERDAYWVDDRVFDDSLHFADDIR